VKYLDTFEDEMLSLRRAAKKLAAQTTNKVHGFEL
jgi:hypothetical protein